MRQVNYIRPIDWVDPFQEQQVETPSKQHHQSSKSLSNNSDAISVNSTLPTERSIRTTTTNTSRSSRSTRRISQIRELRTSNLEKHNKDQSSRVELHLRSSKRSTSSHSLKSAGNNSVSLLLFLLYTIFK